VVLMNTHRRTCTHPAFNLIKQISEQVWSLPIKLAILIADSSRLGILIYRNILEKFKYNNFKICRRKDSEVILGHEETYNS